MNTLKSDTLYQTVYRFLCIVMYPFISNVFLKVYHLKSWHTSCLYKGDTGGDITQITGRSS